MKSKKLVLVLDLDNTLLHSKEHPIYPYQLKRDGINGNKLVDKLKSKYHIWAPGFSYLVKIRPFFREFIQQAMQLYDLYFYTAATRVYGNVILEVLKHEIKQVISIKEMEITFNSKRLITRDDKSRFTEQNNQEAKDRELDQMREAERRVMANEVSILNSRVLEREILKLNYTHKTLDALAGGDDKIFVILDFFKCMLI